MRPLIPSCGFLLLTVISNGCERRIGPIKCSHDAGMRTYEQWRASVRFPYTAPQVRKEKIAKNFDRVGVGSTKDDFVAALGEPDYEQELYPKEPNRPCKGYELTYHFEKLDADLVNEERDQRVDAFFSLDGKATWIHSNISGLSENGGPASK